MQEKAHDVRRVIDPVDQVEIEVPPFASVERALRRYARKRDGRLRTIRFFPDVGNAASLWEDGTESYLVDPADLNLSAHLVRDLGVWHEEWEAAVFSGGQVPEHWQRQGDDLLRLIRQELWDVSDIVDAR